MSPYLFGVIQICVKRINEVSLVYLICIVAHSEARKYGGIDMKWALT